MKVNQHNLYALDTMLSQHNMEVGVKKMHRMVFHRQYLTWDEMQRLHDAVASVLDGERNKGLAVRAEIIAMLYVALPEALFNKTALTTTVVSYYKDVMHLSMANFSAYKKTLAFLYFNDKKFRGLAKKTIEAAIDAVNAKEFDNQQ